MQRLARQQTKHKHTRKFPLNTSPDLHYLNFPPRRFYSPLPFHAHIPALHFAPETTDFITSSILRLRFVPGLWRLALPQHRRGAPHPQKKVPCPEKGAPLFLLLPVLGGVRNLVSARKSTINDQKIKKESKVNRKLTQKSSVQALRVFEKISSLRLSLRMKHSGMKQSHVLQFIHLQYPGSYFFKKTAFLKPSTSGKRLSFFLFFL